MVPAHTKKMLKLERIQRITTKMVPELEDLATRNLFVKICRGRKNFEKNNREMQGRAEALL